MRTNVFLLIGVAIAAPGHALMLGDAERGKTLHDANCIQCHAAKFGGDGSAIYTRADHRIKTVEGLLGQVNFCNNQIGAGFDDDQINDIVKYLNDTYYKFE